jgi:hypothetical protein
MENQIILTVLTLLALVGILYVIKNRENFDIPCGRSSGWGWNTGPGYGAGYGTGYAMWGVWPSKIPTRPWKNWMWGRRPNCFMTHQIPAPQIDYGPIRI